jgi:hypothetical protein
MARALGVPDGAAQQPPADSTPGPEIELDGRRYTTSQLRDLINGGSDYTKKTQALAAERAAFQTQQQQLQSQADALAQVLPFIQPEIARLQQALQDVRPPDASLIDSNPQEYIRQQRMWEDGMREQQRLAGLNQLQTQAQQRAAEQRLNAANEALAKEFPAWGDPAQRASWQQEIVNWALEKGGYSRADLTGLTDARHLKTMIKALQFDRMIAGVRTAAPMSVNGAALRGQAPPPAASAQVQRAEDAFDARPSVRSGAALLLARRGGLAR